MTFDIPQIKTEFWRKPGPTNKHDWLAFYADDEPNDAGCMDHGDGATETDAICDLIENHPRSEPQCCLGLSPERCATVPGRQCEGQK